ncbi:hypothetical protein H6G33_35870 [Calothrix sp. FACHB-1219]|uniref:hypothetical protein n=1 Tax=unclassified Calothrix TaxID=2619626 RepID=UPI001685C7DD|nr:MULTISPECIES: hypothetical protein [unclassified Calothrix]MBD2207708.1 hypothetical protein [Calothrix sp. FACHB-168]MBD2222312.1 hypothetical protein [Calothrix sp. FACHB-1219]
MLLNFKAKKKRPRFSTGKKNGKFKNIVLVMGFLLGLPISTFIIIYSLFHSSSSASLFSFLYSNKESPYATSIPWIDNAAECQDTQREWHDNKCWDKEHSPSF